MYHLYQAHLQWSKQATRTIPKTFWWSFGLGFLIFLGQTLIVSLYEDFAKDATPVVGIVVSLLFGYWLVRYVFSYQEARLKAPVKNYPFYVGLQVIILWCLANSWAWFGNHGLHLDFNKGAISSNQVAINSFLQHPSSGIVITVSAIFLAPALEEFVFRLLIMRPHGYQSKRGNLIAAVISLGLFTYIHIMGQVPALSHGNLPVTNFVFYCGQYAMIGLVMVYNYYRYRSLLLNYTIHATWNTYSIIMNLIIIFCER